MKSFKSIFVKTIFAVSLFFLSGNLLMAQVQPVSVAIADPGSQIKFTGLEGDMLVFEVQLDHLPAKGTTLQITDNQDHILFEEKINTTSHSCRYKIIRDNMEFISFKVSGKTFSFNQSFSINYKVEERMEVKKV